MLITSDNCIPVEWVFHVTDELRVPQAGSDPDDGSGYVILGVQLAQEYFHGKPACDFNDLMKLIVPQMPS